ncbi:hypothetical protein G6F36_012198 [Rhizopus arrhizus]|nr:hypothetical protein G6F36_012198 [Rhizopus arrhizus]
MSNLNSDIITLESNDPMSRESTNMITESGQTETKEKPHPDLVAIEDSFKTLETSEEEAYKVLTAIAATNEVSIPWSELRIMMNRIISKQSRIMDPKIHDNVLRSEIDKITINISQILGTLRDCPFTIQRACELIVNPNHHYKTYVKYLRAFEKIITVTSSWKDFVNKSTDNNTTQNEANQIKASFIFDNVEIQTESLEYEDDEQMEIVETPKTNGAHQHTTEANELLDVQTEEAAEKAQKKEVTENGEGTIQQTVESQEAAEKTENALN